MVVFNALRAVMLIGALLAAPSVAQAQTERDRSGDREAFPAHRMIGNIHYVGTETLNSYLITTPEGHILINTNFEDTLPLLQESVETLGFQFSDIRIVLGSHAHADHMQANAMVKEMTGATVMAMEEDVPALRNMTPGDKPHPIDRVLRDGDQVSLGGTTLTAHLTPGHMRGCTTWTMQVTEDGRTYDALILCGGIQPNTRFVDNTSYPEIADDFRRSIAKYRTLPVDVYLGSHSWFFDLAGKHARLGGPENPYIDPEGYRAYIDTMENDLNRMLAEQQGSASRD